MKIEVKKSTIASFFTLVGLVLVGSNQFSHAACTSAPAGLVSWWPAEGNALDLQGTNNGNFSSPAYGPGEVGAAFSFNGKGNNVRVPASVSLDVGAGAGLTLEAWIFTTDSSYAQPILEWVPNSPGTYGVHFYVHQGGAGAVYADLYDTANNHHMVQSAPGLVALNSFQHVAITYDKASGVAVMYVNGTQVLQLTVGTFTPQTSPDLSIGLRPSTVPFGPISFLGQIDEVSVYSRGLSATEIHSIYAAGTAGKCSTVPPTIVSQPTNSTVMTQSTVTFSVLAGGSAPLTYQWSMDGTNLPGATSASLSLTNVTTNAAGIYAVGITNGFGGVVSSNVVLTVIQGSCVAPPSGLVSWWPAEGNAADVTWGNTGLPANGAGFDAGVDGQAFAFNGTSSYVQVPDDPSLSFTNAFTIEFWYKDNGVPAGAYAGLVAKRPYSGPCNYGLTIIGGTPGSFMVYLFDPNYGSYEASTYTGLPAPGSWHHLAAIYRQATSELIEIKSYVDGQLVLSNQLPGSLSRTVNNYPVYFGCSNPPGGEFFKGDLDEISIYGRALADAEIAAIFNAGSYGKCLVPAPPAVFAQPTNQTVFAGSTVQMVVDAIGAPPLSYQWVMDGTNLPGATNATLVISNVQPFQAGTYSVSITNNLGSTNSSDAALTVNLPPPCSPVPSGLAAWWQGEGSANDSVGTDNGTINSGITFVPGVVGQAFNFDGVSGAVVVPASPSLNVQNLTLETWIYPTDLSRPRPIFEFANATGYSTVNFWYDLGTGARPLSGALFAAARDATNLNNNFYVASAGGLLPANKWSHVAFTFDSVAGKAVLFINGVGIATNSFVPNIHPNTHVAANLGYRPVGSSELYAGARHIGKLDEVSLYDRVLSPSELQAIYAAGASGKCLTPLAPSIVTQPAGQVLQIGATATLSVGASGTQPLSYQWSLGTNAIIGATNASLILTNVQMNQAGGYSVVVTNLYGAVTSSNAALVVNFPPAAVNVVSASGGAGEMVTIPVVLVANGNENAVGFSLNFSPTQLTNVGVTLGTGATGASLQFNSGAAGTVGVAVAMPSGTTFAPGTQEVAEVSFVSAVSTSAYSVPLTFGDLPTKRELSDAKANPLAVNFTDGQVNLTRSSFEGDVSPRPDGDGSISIIDWVQVGRYVAALDSPTNASEFQRADCAPRSSAGDGLLTVSDWVQAGRYAAGLDQPTLAGGPTAPTGHVISPQHKDGSSNSRIVTVQGPLLFQGQTATAIIELDAQGDENAVGLSLSFDPKVVTYTGTLLGADATSATMEVNANAATNGQLGIALALPSPTASFAAGTRQLLKVSFQAVTPTSIDSAVTLTDLPVRREVADTNALPVAASYSNGLIEVNPRPSLSIAQGNQTLSLSWPLWATNYNLQQAIGTTAPLTTWTNLALAPVITNNALGVTIPVSGSAQFYRLQHQ